MYCGKSYMKGGDILSVADRIHRAEQSWTYSTGTGLYWNNIELSLNNDNKVTCCATYVSCVIYAAGYATEAQMNSFNYNYVPSFYTYFKEKGWEEVTSYDQLEPGDIVFTGNFSHVQIYAGNNTWYNAGATEYIQKDAPQDQGGWARSNFTTALRPSPLN